MRTLIKPASVTASVILVVVAILAVTRIAGSGKSSLPTVTEHSTASSTAGSSATSPPAEIGTNPLLTARGAFVADIDRAQKIIDDTSSTNRELADAGRLEQLATLVLYRESKPVRGKTLVLLGQQAAFSVRANLDAAAALSGLTVPHKRFPPWKIVQPPAPKTLLGYFRAAQARFGVPWEDLAAIELIESTFGRVRGPSSAGAQGPMQFMPATWARYGSGHINDSRDAILSAARYLAANGAPADMADALYHYNNSVAYIHAVQDYARRMRTDEHAYYGYYYWQVIYPHARGMVILPVGYPKVRPVPLRPTGISPQP